MEDVAKCSCYFLTYIFIINLLSCNTGSRQRDIAGFSNISLYVNQALRAQLNSYTNYCDVLGQGFVRSFGAQVDCFFVISGFLTTLSILRDLRKHNSFRIINIIILALKKYFRLTPLMLVSAILSYLADDCGTRPLSRLLFESSLLQSNESRSPLSLVVAWSSRVDFIASLLMAFLFVVIFRIFKISFDKNKYGVAIVCILGSLLPSAFTIFHYPQLNPSTLLSLPNAYIPVFMSRARVDWLSSHYNLPSEPGDSLPIGDHPLRLLYAFKLYLPWYCRWTPFFIGMFLAISYEDILNNKLPRPNALLRSFCAGASVLMLLLPTALGYISRNAAMIEAAPSLVNQPSLASMLSMIIIRPLFAAAFGFVMIGSIVPSHFAPILSPLAKVLALPVLSIPGKYTYGVYILHFRILLEMIFRWMPFKALLIALPKYPVFSFIGLYALSSFGLALIIAYLCYYTVEYPAIWLSNKIANSLMNKKFSKQS